MGPPINANLRAFNASFQTDPKKLPSWSRVSPKVKPFLPVEFYRNGQVGNSKNRSGVALSRWRATLGGSNSSQVSPPVVACPDACMKLGD
jgi:hypothetical protein